MMRHCSVTLTMDTYGHQIPGQEAETVARLPDMFGDMADGVEVAETEATNDDPPPEPRQLAHDSVRGHATSCDEPDSNSELGAAERNCKSLGIAQSCVTVRVDAKKRRGGDSNPRDRDYPAQRFSKPPEPIRNRPDANRLRQQLGASGRASGRFVGR